MKEMAFALVVTLGLVCIMLGILMPLLRKPKKKEPPYIPYTRRADLPREAAVKSTTAKPSFRPRPQAAITTSSEPYNPMLDPMNIMSPLNPISPIWYPSETSHHHDTPSHHDTSSSSWSSSDSSSSYDSGSSSSSDSGSSSNSSD